MSPRVRSVEVPAVERGASIVEVALILPLLMALILGVVSGGIAYQRKISLTDAVREGARYGATLDAGTIDPSTGTFHSNEFATWSNRVRTRVAELSGGELEVDDVCAQLVKVPDSTNACGVTDPAGSSGLHVAKVSASRNSTLEAFFFSRTLTLRSSAAARFEREQS